MLAWQYRDEINRSQLLPDKRVLPFVDNLISTDSHQGVLSNATGSIVVIYGRRFVRLFSCISGRLITTVTSEEPIVSAQFSSNEEHLLIHHESSLSSVDLMFEDPSCAQLWSSPVQIVSMSVLSEATASGYEVITLDSEGSLYLLSLSHAQAVTADCRLSVSRTRSFSMKGFTPTAFDTDGSFLVLTDGRVLKIFHAPTFQLDTPMSVDLEFVGELQETMGPVTTDVNVKMSRFENTVCVIVRLRSSVAIYHFDELKKEMRSVHEFRDAIAKPQFISIAVTQNLTSIRLQDHVILCDEDDDDDDVLATAASGRPMLLVSSKEGSKSRIEMLDLKKNQIVVRSDVSKLGPVTSAHFVNGAIGKSFVTVFDSVGSSVLWSHGPIDKKDNWQTCIPNLRPCFTNQEFKETEEMFDFNQKHDPKVVSLFKKSSQSWNVLPPTSGKNPRHQQDQVNIVEDGLHMIHPSCRRIPSYPFFNAEKIFDALKTTHNVIPKPTNLGTNSICTFEGTYIPFRSLTETRE